MRHHELSDEERESDQRLPPRGSRGVPRVDDRRVTPGSSGDS